MTGKAIIVTAPSGSGKTSIIKPLLKKIPELSFSISATTRTPREGEINGKDYHFFTLPEFDHKVSEGDFVEWEEVYPGKRYGTLKSEVDRLWSMDKVVIFDVEVKGAMNLKKYFGDSALSIFIRVPNVEVLKDRLLGRNTENDDSLQERLDRAEFEMSLEDQFDVTVVNEDLNRAIDETTELVRSFISAS